MSNNLLEDLRFTKCYEEPTRLSEFIGIDHTTKDSTDEELLVIYNKAHAAYQIRTRDGVLWQTVHSIIFGKDGIEHLWCQENWDKDYISAGNVEDVRVNGVSVVVDRIANIEPEAQDVAYENEKHPDISNLKEAVDELFDADTHIDGGSASTVYLVSQEIDGGYAQEDI